MAKPRTPNQKKRYAALNKRLAKYVSLVQNIYDTLAVEAAGIVMTYTDYSSDAGVPFRFKDYPLTKNRVNELMRFFSHDLQALIYAGTTDEWKNSNIVQDLLANDVLKVYGMKRNGEKVKRYYQPNNDALKAFQRRKDKGFTVSQKTWNQSYNFKRELEYAISSGIEKGQSAVTLSKRISKYLHDYPSLCDDYKEKYGTAVDCKNCEYRSIRLARSEINMAYRTAEQTRWQQMDFIKGYEIKLSNSHPKYDICDELAGIYPKWFKWVSWHPNCLCYCIPIVMTDDEWYSGKGQVIDDMPDNFIQWARENRDRMEEAVKKGTAPYWVQDNLEKVREAAKPYVFDKEASDTLLMRGFDKIYPKGYNQSAISGFDLLRFDDDIQTICDSTGIQITKRGIRFETNNITKKDRVTISYEGTNNNGEGFELVRVFKRNLDGSVSIQHEHLELPDELQGIGVGKALFRSMVPQYLAMGADEIQIYANITRGGYAWGRYGFSASEHFSVEFALENSMADKEIVDKARSIVNTFYSNRDEKTPFPMNLLASQPWGYDLLHDTGWSGVLNLKDRKAVRYLKSYIGL